MLDSMHGASTQAPMRALWVVCKRVWPRCFMHACMCEYVCSQQCGGTSQPISLVACSIHSTIHVYSVVWCITMAGSSTRNGKARARPSTANRAAAWARLRRCIAKHELLALEPTKIADAFKSVRACLHVHMHGAVKSWKQIISSGS